MFRLRTLGVLDLRDGADRPVVALLAQPKRVALLCYLAMAPGGRRRRDTVLAVFWPESDARRARRALGQALYVMRRALGAAALPSLGDDEVGVDPALVSCDAAELATRVAAGDLAGALELYGGDFLNGLHLPDAPEYERWVDEERTRLRGLAVGAARGLAAREAAAGNAVGALPWLRHALRLEPLDEPALRELLLALARAGDRGGAIREYETFARRYLDELELEPDAETRELVRGIREASLRDLPREPGALPGGPSGVPSPAEAPAPSGARAGRGWPRPLVVAAAAVGLIVTGALVQRSAVEPAGGESEPGVRVLVLPVVSEGGARAAALTEGVGELLRQKLTVPGVAVAELAPRGSRRPVTGGVGGWGRNGAASRNGAPLVVRGTVIEAGGRFEVMATLAESGGATRSRATEAAKEEAELFSAVEAVARQLLPGVVPGPAGRPGRGAAATTTSLDALRWFLIGEARLREGRYGDAVDAFEAAVARDSLLALGWYRLSSASLWADQQRTDVTAADARAVRLSGSLPRRDSLVVKSYAAWRVGRADTAEYLARAVVDAYPDDVEAWHQLGETLFHYNAVRGRPMAEAGAPFRRVLALDPGHLSAAWHLAQLGVAAGDGSEAAPHFRTLLASAGPAGRTLEIRALNAFRRAEPGPERRIMEELADADLSLVAGVIRMSAVTLGDLERAEQVARLLVAPDHLNVPRMWGHAQLAYLDLARGRVQSAREQLDVMDRLDPDGGFEMALPERAIIALLPVLPVDTAELRILADRFEARPPEPVQRPVFDTYPARWHYFLGRLYARLGALERALGHAAALDALPDPAAPGWSAGVRAAVAVVDGRHDDALRILESTPVQAWFGFGVTSAPHSGAAERWLRAELLAAAGQDEDAIRWYATFGEHSVHDLIYLAASHLRRAAIHEGRGESGVAADHRAAARRLWRDPAPELIEALGSAPLAR